MALLPQRHPNKDFFILDIADAVPKDDTASMEHPMFSLATKPDMRHLEYRNGDNVLKIKPSADGLPTIFDKDILIFCISQLMAKKNRGEEVSKRVRFSAREMMIATNRNTGGIEYKRVENALSRLRGTNFITNVRTGKKIETRIFGLIDEGGFVRSEENFERNDYCEVVLSDWVMNAIKADEVVTISEQYFRLRRPLERRLYEIARKHCGAQSRWQIGLSNLQNKTGSNAPLKKFRHNLRQIIEDNHTPFYTFEIDEKDLVTVRPRKAAIDYSVPLNIKLDTEEKARKICVDKNLDFFNALSDWRDFARSQIAKGMPPKSPDGSFIGWLNKQDSNERISYG
jgi:plasmid replication initiation protein